MRKHIYLSLLIGLLLITVASKSQAETYRGDFCWQVFENETPAWTYRFGVYEKEGGRYALFGSDDDGQGGTTAAHGNAEVAGSDIKMTILSSGYKEEFGAWNETFHANLSNSTLSGTWHTISIVYDANDTLIPSHRSGTVSHITCPG